jgi:hypothetical protein
MIKNVMFGADPELFLKGPHGGFVSSIGKIGGTKANPRDIGGGGAVQEDNVAVEFNIQPSITKEQFIRSLHVPLDYLNEYVGNTLGLQLEIVPSAVFPTEELADPRALVFGCEPDENARPETPFGLENLRTCGGHLHVSWDNPEHDEKVRLVRALDLFAGVASTYHDTDVQRRTLYGKAGACRYKSYGVEYRTLSNWWITSDDRMGWLYDRANEAIEFVNSGKGIDRRTQALIIQAIDQNNKKAADALVKNFSLTV